MKLKWTNPQNSVKKYSIDISIPSLSLESELHNKFFSPLIFCNEPSESRPWFFNGNAMCYCILPKCKKCTNKSQNVKGKASYMKYMQGSTAETSQIPALKEVLRGFNFLNVSKVFGKQNLSIMAMPLKRNQPRKKVTMPPLLMVDRSPSHTIR